MSNHVSIGAVRYRVYDRTGGGEYQDVEASGLADAIRQGRAWIEAGDWLHDDESYDTLDMRLQAVVAEHVLGGDGELDEEAMRDRAEDCSGVCPASTRTPRTACGDDDACHDWRDDHALVGGVAENPGVRGSDHGSISATDACRDCGMLRTVDYGATDMSDGTQTRRVRYVASPIAEASRRLR